MGGHVVFAFGGVLENGIAVGSEPGEEAFQIVADFGVGIFLDEK